MEAYERLRPLGRGAFGVVHLGRCRQTRRLVVLKSIPMPEEDTKQALNEVQVLRLLSHPNIIEYVSSHVQEQSLVIVMEYAPGGTLRDYLLSLQQQPMEEEQVLHFFSQMLIAVQHIHGLNILHRDLKSENILLDRERQVIKIGDFGISKILATKTSASSVVGTPCYLSPELCEGRPYNRKSDVWALGCLLYEMATLRRTFEAATLAALVLKILRGSYTPLPAQLTAGLRQLVTSLLSLDQVRRPSVTQAIAHPVVAPHACRLFSDIGMIPWHASTRPLSMSVSQTLAGGRVGPLGAVWAARRPASPSSPPPQDDTVWTLTPELALRQLTPPPPGAGRRLASAARGSLSAVCVTGGGQAAVWWLADAGPPLTVERPAGVSFVQAASGGATVALLTQRGIMLTAEATAAGALTPPRIVQPLLGHEVAQLSCGPDHTLARTAAGDVFAWGANADGQLGGGGRRPASAPQPLPLPAGVTAARVRAAAGCSLVVTADGRVLGCGLNAAGRLGSGEGGGRPGERRLRLTLLPAPEPVSDAVPCASRTALLTVSGALLWLGGQLGAAPVRSPLPGAVTAVCGSEAAVMALCSDGSLHAVSETNPRQPVRLELPGAGQPRLGDGGVLLLSP